MTTTTTMNEDTPQARLEAEVEAHKAKLLAAGKPLPEPIFPTGDQPEPWREELRRMAEKHGGADLITEDIDPRERSKQAAAELEVRWRQASWEKRCPERYREAWRWDLVKPGVQRSEVLKVTAWQYGERGLYIYGESGRSKTRALYVLLKRLILAERRDVKIFDGPGFSTAASRAFSEPAETDRWLDPICRVAVLVIDDLGKRWTPATEDAAFTVIDRRTAAKLPTLVTANYTGEQLQQMSNARNELAIIRDMTSPLRRRLTDYSDAVIF